jgi:hypothetical protein
MKILISSYFFSPELTPRAFRTYELVRELCNEGHYVKLYLPAKSVFSNYSFTHENLEIKFVGSIENTPCNNESIPAKSPPDKKKYRLVRKFVPKAIKKKISAYLEWRLRYLYPVKDRSYLRNTIHALKEEIRKYDFIISIGLPIEVHIAMGISLFNNKSLRRDAITVAEYGDPFSTRQTLKVLPLYYLIDWMLGRIFDYIIVPTPRAVGSYKHFKKLSHIKVIPQGFNLQEYTLKPYTKNLVPTFAYAGVLYHKLRNPSSFLNYLTHLEYDFRFCFFTINGSVDTEKILAEYKDKLDGKLQVFYDSKRENLIKELSGMDFLINFENESDNQSPSKLIDYGIAGRPICPISTGQFNTDIFDEFCGNNYEHSVKVNLNEHDIKIIAGMFLDLQQAL